MTIISLLVLSSFGLSSCIAGPIIPGNSQLYQEVKQRNGTTIMCKKITEENRCIPGHEIEECDYQYDPMKCVPCRLGYYQCDYLTSDASIKCYQPECPELGKETMVKVTNNSDGTCNLECVCNESKGYSGSDYRDCTLQTTVCGVDSELKNGVCVGCKEGYHNPDEEFGVCVHKPVSTSATVTTLSSDIDGNRNATNVQTSTTNVKTPTDTPPSQMNKSGDQTTENTPPHNQRPPRDNKSSVSGVPHDVMVGIVVAVPLILFVAAVVLFFKRGAIICCSNLETPMNKYGKVAQADAPCQPNQPGPPGPSPQPTIPAPEQPSTGDPSDQTFNISLIFAKADQDLAFEIKKRLNEMVLIGGVRVKVWDFNDPSFDGSKLHLPKQFTSESCLVLVVMTDNTLKDTDCQFMTEEAVALTRFDGEPNTKTYSVRPLHTQPPNERNYGIPDGLASIIPVDWFGPNYEDKLRELCIHLSDETTASNSD